MPPDVRKVYDLPRSKVKVIGATPPIVGVALNYFDPEGRA